MLRDRRGLTVSTRSTTALEACERAVEGLNGLSGDPLGAADEALAADPACVLAACVKAGALIMSADRPAEEPLREAVEHGERHAAAATERERRHLAAARAWLERDFARAIAAYGRLATEHPRDVLALQVAHTGHFLLGQQALLRDQLAQVLHAWDEAVPGYGYVLGMYAFGLEETGDYRRAEEVGRRAVELNPADAWASHAVAHVMEMNARIDEGISWLEETGRAWAPDSFIAYHNHWHAALFHLDRGEVAPALALYDARIRPARSDVGMELVDASALLWRLLLRGHDAGERARTLAEDWARRIDDRYYAFNDAHAIMAFAAAGRDDDVGRSLRAVEASAALGGTNAAVVREVGLPVCRALAAFARGRWEECVEELFPVRHAALRMGGSNAQRDVLSLTLVEAALRAGRAALARALASERVRLRPASPPAWTITARALDLAGDAAQATRAWREAEKLRARASGAVHVRAPRTERAVEPGRAG
jgi:tetratricopeptide (TPR) repeat protein